MKSTETNQHEPQRDLPRAIPRRVHALGAGGAGVSAALRILVARGHGVTGQDLVRSEHTDLLCSLGVSIGLETEAAQSLPPDTELLVRSAAIPKDHPCVVEAQRRGVPVWKYAQLLGCLHPNERCLAVSGTHGKTTTSWMLYHAVRGMAERYRLQVPDPWALVGGICRNTGSNSVVGQPGGWLAVEACEYDRSFLELTPRAAIVGNVEADHLDYYGDLEAVHTAFAQFVGGVQVEGLVVLGPDVPEVIERAAQAEVWRAGRDFDWEVRGDQAGRARMRVHSGPAAADHWDTGEFTLSVPGDFNAENAALAVALAVGQVAREAQLDLNLAAQAAALSCCNFRGAKRRFEPWAEADGIQVVHDYAHHPTELRKTLAAARKTHPDAALHVLFQPHQHSRTARFLDGFVESLSAADRVVVADVYGARTHIDGVSAGAAELVAGLEALGVSADLGGPKEKALQVALQNWSAPTLLLVIGAGDIEDLQPIVCNELALRSTLQR